MTAPMADAIIQPAAESDLDEIADFIAQDSFDSAIRFYRAAFADFWTLASMPGMGAKRPSRNPAYAGLRTWPIKGFRNYLVCYRH